MEKTDGELVKEVQKGNIEAFETLVKRYEGRLFNYVFGITRSSEDSEEVIQDTFLQIYKTIGRIDIQRKISSYIYKIAKNKAISYLRKNKKEVPLDEEIYVFGEEDSYDDLIKKDTTKKVETSFRKLSEKYSKSLKMYYLEELSYKEIAKRMKLSINTVRTRLRRGRKEFKKIWNKRN